MFKGLYAITDSQLLPDARLLSQVEAALAGGLALLQYRDKSTDSVRRRRQAQALLALCRRYGTPLIINDDLALAQEIGADGVHLGQGDASLAAARQQLGPDAIVGATCHASLDLAQQAVAAGASYVAFGRFFPSRTKPDAPPAPLSLLQQARARLNVPVVAIGGINVDNAPQLISAGADLLAVVHALFAADDVTARARQFNALFSEG